MPNRMILFVPVMLVILLAAVTLPAGSSRAERAGNDCLSKPGSQASEGHHWYYRVDRATNRRCWYLGQAGTKVRKAAFVKRRSALRPVPQPTARTPTEAMVANTHAEAIGAQTRTEGTAGENDPADFSMRWPGYSRSTAAIERELELMISSFADEHATMRSRDDMPLNWPILTPADLAAAEQPPRSPLTSEPAFGLVAGALAFAALVAGTILKIFAARQPRRADHGDHRRAAVKVVLPRRPVQSVVAAAATRESGAARKPHAAIRRTGIGAELARASAIPMQSGPAPDAMDLSQFQRRTAARAAGECDRPCDLSQDIEQGLRQLLHGWQGIAA